MSKDLIEYFKKQNDNSYSLTVGEASSHMLAMHKFMEQYLKDFREKNATESEQKAIAFEEEKILKFLEMMVSIVSSSKLDNYLYETTVVSKDQLKALERSVVEFERSSKENLYIALTKLNEESDKLKENLDNL